MTPEFWNTRLSGRAFIPVGDPAYPDIVQRINALKCDGEEIEIPEITAAGAWDQLFRVYTSLKDRAAREEAAAAQHGPPANAVENERWNRFLQNRQDILMLVLRGVFDNALLVDHLGMHEGDLSDPVLPEADKYGNNRVPDWRARAERLSWVLHKWGALSDDDRACLKMEKISRKLKGNGNG